ncbi:hypothetical protein [Flavobacterium adhaerens]|uniref:hypothetical protein n=1 Tax=Flavobacterium adhaerens TaxID=3149043 RepID=UPI0032B402AA
MKIIQTAILSLEQKQVLFELWNFEYPVKVTYSHISEFENYLNELPNKFHYLLLDDQKQVLGWTFTFTRDLDNWFVILIRSEIKGKGFGRILLNQLKKNNSALNGWVIDHDKNVKLNGEPYRSPLAFYIKNGFQVIEDIRLENDKISAVKIRFEHN